MGGIFTYLKKLCHNDSASEKHNLNVLTKLKKEEQEIIYSEETAIRGNKYPSQNEETILKNKIYQKKGNYY